MIWDWISRTAGTLLILVGIADVYLTVLYARSGTGLLSPKINAAVWNIFRFAARRFNRRRRDIILSFTGPTLLVIVATGWVLLFILGFALVFWPALGESLRASQGPTSTDFLTAVFVSGYNFTTLGVGSIVPHTGGYRMLTILEAGLGFSLFTLVITYFLSLYNALRERNSFASALDHKTGGNGNAGTLISRLCREGSMRGASEELGTMAVRMSDLLESHKFYPVIHYFRFREIRYALPRITWIAMDTLSLIRSALDPEETETLSESAAAGQLWNGGMNLLRHLAEAFLPSGFTESFRNPPQDIEGQWREHYLTRLHAFREAGLPVHPDPEKGLEVYIRMRREWHAYVAAFTHSMLFAPEDIHPPDTEIEKDSELP